MAQWGVAVFVWSDKVQTKPSGPHWPVAPFAIVAVNAGLRDAWLVLNIGLWSWWAGLLLGVLRDGGHSRYFLDITQCFRSHCLLGWIETRGRGQRCFKTRRRVPPPGLVAFSMASESQHCGALDRWLHDIVVRVIGVRHMCVGVLMCTRERVHVFIESVCATPGPTTRSNISRKKRQFTKWNWL